MVTAAKTKPAYTGITTATGGPAENTVKSASGIIDLAVKSPGAPGGDPKATNPVDLFSAAMAVCFKRFVNTVGIERGLDLANATVIGHVPIYVTPEDGYWIGLILQISIPQVDRATAESIAHEAHARCPFSKAVDGNIEITLEIV